ncbi:MAG: class I SAM-dependent methyltransferase [Fimbriimonadaceae bacterium]|nr:class I SAM-dependent methyltransferase [Fimbriimonadaceae bacterium]
MSQSSAHEPHNDEALEQYRARGGYTMGPWTSFNWRDDPRRLGFSLARYKFCAKMLAGRERVLEVGCGDAFGALVVRQTVGAVHGIDLEPQVIDAAAELIAAEGLDRLTVAVHDLLAGPLPARYDAAYCLDVIEHLPAAAEATFVEHLVASLAPTAVLIVGTPNLEAARFASAKSQAGHINLFDAPRLHRLLARWFENVFDFGMNDEVLHTGYAGLAHYLFAMGVGKRER